MQNDPRLKLGREKSPEDKRNLQFAAYVEKAEIPKIPASFGFDHAFPPNGWGMMGNDDYGDCVWAGAVHEHDLWGARGAGTPSFVTQNALDAYAGCTGFDPGNPASDQGTNMLDAAKYRRSTGIVDDNNNVHRIGAFLQLDLSFTQLWQALYVCEAVGIGIQFPETAMTQFNQNKPWAYVKGAQIEGGHYIPGVAKQSTKTLSVISWGRMFHATQEFLGHYMDEAFAYVSVDAFSNAGVTRRGLNYNQLIADIDAL